MLTTYILGYRLRNFEIRVGNNTKLANNKICYEQTESVGNGLGIWVSVNKSDNETSDEHLQLTEVRVFGSKYSVY